jgi:hypothetical protein
MIKMFVCFVFLTKSHKVLVLNIKFDCLKINCILSFYNKNDNIHILNKNKAHTIYYSTSFLCLLF